MSGPRIGYCTVFLSFFVSFGIRARGKSYRLKAVDSSSRHRNKNKTKSYDAGGAVEQNTAYKRTQIAERPGEQHRRVNSAIGGSSVRPACDTN